MTGETMQKILVTAALLCAVLPAYAQAPAILYASAADVEDGIGAARHAFDKGDWAGDARLRVASLKRLQEHLRRLADDYRVGSRDAAILEPGLPGNARSQLLQGGAVQFVIIFYIQLNLIKLVLNNPVVNPLVIFHIFHHE